jgi:DNA-binding CsgD family transcriptional regulator
MMSTEHRQEGAAARRTFDTVIVSASQVVGVALQHLLEDRLDGLTAYRLDLSELLATPTGFCPDLLVLAPQSWDDLALWLPQLQDRFSSCPWLLFSEPRACGIYLSQLENLTWALVPTTGSPALLRSAIQTLTTRPAPSTSSACVRLFSSLLQAARSTSPTVCPTLMEIQCACAVSLGLSDREAARLLRLRIAAVRSHVRRLMQIMAVTEREDLADTLREALHPARVVSGCQELFDLGAADPHPDR